MKVKITFNKKASKTDVEKAQAAIKELISLMKRDQKLRKKHGF